ncbi:hypothetical protein ACN2CC_02060 [Mesorhizobium muleiense]|uniref:hypothetical protein n=1 Tax=Mesorhizobium muleiense TaxID=1004279 RepID=UPI003AFB0FB9
MTFVLTDESKQQLSDRLSSFWFYLPFKIHPTNHKVELLPRNPAADGVGCRVAVLIDGAPNRQLPPATNPTLAAGGNTLLVEHADYGKLKFNNLMYEGSVSVVRNNEWAELRLFAGVGNAADWIETGSWSRPAFEIAANVNLWQRVFKFGQIDEAAVDATTVELNKTGSPRAVTLVRRLINNTICAEILAVGGLDANRGRPIPILTVTKKEPPAPTAGEKPVAATEGPPSLPDLSLLTGANSHAAEGYVMIAAGAFAAMSADSMLSAFETISDSADAMRRLSQVAWAPDNVSQNDGRLLRKLNNIHDTGRSGVFEGSGLNTDPVEVLHVRASGDDNIS